MNKTNIKTNLSRTGERNTQYETKVASELWLNMGGRDYRLVGKTIRIGRALDNDIILEHISCSRYHTIITISGDKVIFEDLKSRNGIKVNGRKVKRAELKDNDEIQIGDLKGLYFQKVKKPAGKKQTAGFMPFGLEPLNGLLARLKSGRGLSSESGNKKKTKLMMLAMLVLCLGFFMMLMSGGSEMPAESASNEVYETEKQAEVVGGVANRIKFENCLQHEDLGNLRSAKQCFKKLPHTVEVSIALERINRNQKELSEVRYKEGKHAFENYYYDIALLKWQEVMMISDDSSEYRIKALKGIADAETRKKQQ